MHQENLITLANWLGMVAFGLFILLFTRYLDNVGIEAYVLFCVLITIAVLEVLLLLWFATS